MPNIFTVPAHRPLVDVLAAQIIADYGKNPLQMAELLVLLPNRAGVLALKNALVKCNKGALLTIPRIRAIGDVDEERLWLESHNSGSDVYKKLHHLPKAISNTALHILLTKQVHKLAEVSNENSVYYPNIEQAASLAHDLLLLLGEAEREEIDLRKLQYLVPEEYSEHWQLNLRFLGIISQYLPAILDEKNLITESKRSSLLANLQILQWQHKQPDYPIIIAGTTGTVPATARLIKQVSSFENSTIILPAFANDIKQNISPSHPQYNLKILLDSLEANSQDIPILGADNILQKQDILLLAMTSSVEWKYSKRNAIEPWFTFIDAANEEEEARAISLIMRTQMQKDNKNIALITANKNLQKRVACYLKAYDIVPSGNRSYPALEHEEIRFLLLIIEVVFSNFAPHKTLAFLKHRFICNDDKIKQEIASLELNYLRGFSSSIEQNDLIIKLTGLKNIFAQREFDFLQMLRELLNVAQKNISPSIREIIENIIIEVSELGSVDKYNSLALLKNILSHIEINDDRQTHKRVFILTPQDARMQHFDAIILGSMNDDDWGAVKSQNKWLNEPMRKSLGFAPSERMIGMAAHDFITLISAAEIFITRAEKVAGCAMLPSRFLQRLQAVGINIISDKKWIELTREIDNPTQYHQLSPPAPKPSLVLRPEKLSLSAIEMLMCNPYGFYAKYILKLRKYDEIDIDVDPRHFGIIIHKSMELFTNLVNESPNNLTHEKLLECGKLAMRDFSDNIIVQKMWWPRFESLIDWLIQTQRERQLEGVEVSAEKEITMQIAQKYTIHGRLDRLETLADGSLRISDYKTGNPPSFANIEKGISPQLPLQAILAESELMREVSAIEYWKLSGTEEARIDNKKTPKYELSELFAASKDGLIATLNKYNDENTPYLYAPTAQYSGSANDYIWLSRKSEWEK
jgi:ATP-dependent helicase/nuclease subunit B